MSLNWIELLQRKLFQASSTYRYLPLKKDQIRVLCLIPLRRADDTSQTTIECELVTVSLDDPPDYEALSYVWGPPLQTHSITINSIQDGRPRLDILPVTASLWVALRHLRYRDEPRYLWVDQICINQLDTAEKNIQVNSMGEIYSKSICSVIWLGPKGPDAELLQDMYTKLSNSTLDDNGPGGVQMLNQEALTAILGASSRQEDKDELISKRRNILQEFLDLPWFTRAWVYQEAVTAPKVDVVWGTIVLPFDFVTGLVVSAYGIAKGSDDRRWHRRIKSTTGFAPLRAMFHDRIAHRNGELDFLNVLWHARKHLVAGNHRDYVYAFLAVNKYTAIDRLHPSNVKLNNSLLLQDRIVPNYADTVEQVYTHLALTSIQTTRTLDILQYIVPTKITPDDYRLPGWVPNWSNNKFTCGSPIFVPGVPWTTTLPPWAQQPWTYPSPTPHPTSSSGDLPVTGYTLGTITTVIPHSFKHAYFSSTLQNALRLDDLAAQIATHYPPSKSKPPPPTRTTILETILANGSFTPSQSLAPYTSAQLLAAYDDEKGTMPARGEDDEGESMRNLIRQMAEVATGKRVFLMGPGGSGAAGGDGMGMIGMGFATVRKGDLVVGLGGCKAPCVVREVKRGRKEGTSREGDGEGRRYKVVGLAFVHGMGGTGSWTGRDRKLERFVLV